MQWTCAKCGQSEKATDWTVLVAVGWRTTPENEFRCSACTKKPQEKSLAPTPTAPLRQRGLR
jgi:hypothetical protein